MRTTVASALLAAAALLASCGDLPDVPVGVCGNHVLEAGEDCDQPGPGCGAPGSAGACRFVCLAGGGCAQPGYACGLDQVCRRPSGTYTLAAAVGTPGDQFEVIDLDRDGRPDVAARGNRDVTLYRNVADASGAHLVPVAAGPLNPDDSVGHGIAVGPFAVGDARPLLAVITLTTVDVYAVRSDAQLAPVAIASVLLPPSSAPPQFLGAVAFAAGEPSMPLFFDPAAAAGPRLVAWDGSGDQAAMVAAVDLAPCGASASSTLAGAVAPLPKANVVALLIDGKHACLVEPSRDASGNAQLAARPLDASTLPGLAAADRLEDPVLADVDGDHTLDVVALLRHPNGDPMMTVDTHFVAWRRDPEGGPPSPATVGMDYVPYYSYQFQTLLTAADFDGDGFDDIADADVIYFNNHTAGTFAWDRFELTNDNIVYEGPARGAGDLDHDGTVDLVLTSVGEGIVTTCLNDGHYPPGFACFTSNTGLPSIGSLVLGDFNGDLTLDVAALGDVPEVAGGENELRLVYGAAYSLPTGNAVALTPYHATAVGIAGSAGRPEFAHYAPQPANELWVALDTGGGAIGLGRGRPVEGSPPAFGLPVPTFDVDFAAARPELRLLRCDDDPPGSGNYVDCSIQSYDGGSPGVAFAQPARATLDRKFPMGTDAYSTNIKFLPEPDDADAVAWVESGGVVLAHPDAASHAYKSALAAPDEGTLDGATFYATEDADGAADPNGDGRAELLVQTIANGACRVLLGRFAPGAPAPASLRTVATVESCVAGKGLDNTDALGTGAPFFLLAPSTDALTLPRQLIATVSTADGRSHLAALAPAADGTFPTPPVLDPARFRPSPGASPAPLPDPAGHRWLATVDMNGDGIPDLLFRTPLGLVAAYADVDRL